jgi:hypothetical protein
MSTTQRLFLAFGAALALLAPPGISAQWPFQEQSAPADLNPVEQFKFVSSSGSSGVPVGWFGTQNGPYTGQVASYPGSPQVTLYCVDYLHDIAPDQVWTVNVSRLTVSDIGDTRMGIAFDDGFALSRYKRAAWLASQFMTNQSLDSWAKLHSAIWSVALDGNDPTKPYYGEYGNWLSQLSAAEASGYQGFDFSEWAVITDVAADDLGYDYNPLRQPGAQEFLVHVTVTPEPETVIMLLSGLLVLGLCWRRGVLG